MIPCCNSWDLGCSTLTAADREWLEGNVVVTSVPEGEKWYQVAQLERPLEDEEEDVGARR